jgi:RNA polymerase sigma factor (sigma-70 family)
MRAKLRSGLKILGALQHPYGVGRGSLADIELLYRERYPVFLRVARATIRDEAAAADAVHDAFVQAVRNRRAFRGEGTLEAWVWRMVVNAALQRRREPQPAVLPDEPVDTGANGFGDPVRALIATLPGRQRLVLFLRHYADLDYAAIASILEIKEGTVGATLHAAHEALRQALEAERCKT